MGWGLPYFDFAVSFAGVSHKGDVRERNEDTWRADTNLGAFLVADGMGGHAAGEVAAALGADTFLECVRSKTVRSALAAYRSAPTLEARSRVLSTLRWAADQAHEAVRGEGERTRGRRGMGTTLDAVVLAGARAFLIHVGDSRAYLSRPTTTIQLTNDHTIGGSLVARGIETPSQPPPPRNALMSVLGFQGKLKIDEVSADVTQGDRIILCSDGVYGPIGDEQQFQSFAQRGDAENTAFTLVQTALDRGGTDNATALVLDVVERTGTDVPSDGGVAQRDFGYCTQSPLFAGLDGQLVGRALSAGVEVAFEAEAELPKFYANDRVGYVLLDGEVVTRDGWTLGPASLLYPESLVGGGKGADMHRACGSVRALRIRSDDFREVCESDVSLAAALYERVARILARR